MDILTSRFCVRLLCERPSSFKLPVLFRLLSSNRTTVDQESQKLYEELSRKIAEFKLQLIKSSRHTYFARSAQHSLRNLKMAVSEMKEKANKLDGLSLISSIPSFASIEVLSNGTTHANPCCIIRTPYKVYLFNCPENTSRLMSSLNVRPHQLNDIFLTSAVWDNFGGMNSLLMSKEDKGGTVRVHSSVGVRHYFECVRPFADSDTASVKYPVQVEERSIEQGSYTDPALKVHYLPLVPLRSPQLSSFGKSPLPRSSLNAILRTDIAYLIEFVNPPRRINAAKLVELGVPNGPHIAQLKSGKEVNIDGRIIKPEEVLFPESTDEQPSVFVVECAGPAYLPSLRESSLLQDFMGRNKSLTYCVHFTPKDMFETAEYSEWMALFGESCKHLVLNGSGSVLPHLEAAHRQQLFMRSIAPHFFRPLKPEFEGIITQDDECEKVGNVYFVRPLQRFSLRGKLQTRENISINLVGCTYLERELSEGTKRCIESYLKLTEEAKKDEDSSTPKLTFLGTASASPSKYRNVTSHLLQTTENSYALIDCGEGTYGQMLVHFGHEKCSDVLVNLHAIFITHGHLDHVNGLYTILLKRKDAFVNKGVAYRPLVLVCNPNIMKPLDMYSRSFSDLTPLVFFVNLYKSLRAGNFQRGQHTQGRQNNAFEVATDVISLLPKELFNRQSWGIQHLKAVQVHHTRMASGYVFTLTSGHKIVFSGDTKPCKALADHGSDADLLVHEATFEDGLEAHALSKKHSTMQQAVDIGLQMKAKHIILSHFSARYAKVPCLPSYLDDLGNVSVALDNLTVNFENLDLLPKLNPIYREVYQEELFELRAKLDQQRLREQEVRKMAVAAEGAQKHSQKIIEKNAHASCKRKASSELSL